MTSTDQEPIVPAGMTEERARQVREFVEKISQSVDDLELDDGSHEELRGHISQVEDQLKAEEPHHSMVDEALLAMQRLLASSSTQKAAELIQEAGRFLTGVG